MLQKTSVLLLKITMGKKMLEMERNAHTTLKRRTLHVKTGLGQCESIGDIFSL